MDSSCLKISYFLSSIIHKKTFFRIEKKISYFYNMFLLILYFPTKYHSSVRLDARDKVIEGFTAHSSNFGTSVEEEDEVFGRQEEIDSGRDKDVLEENTEEKEEEESDEEETAAAT